MIGVNQDYWKRETEELADKGFRILAFAYSIIDEPEDDFFHHLNFLGCGAFLDPPREEIYEEILQAIALSKLTALTKPNGRVRGISAGDSFRRFVTKIVARQFQDTLRDRVAPLNFGLCHRGGTDSLIHLI